MKSIKDILNKIRKVNTEPEYEEKVEHDIVMVRTDGEMVEVTGDGSEEGKQE